MRVGKAKLAREAAARSCRENGDRVEEIFREAEEVEGEVKRFIRLYRKRLERYRDRVAGRTNGATASAEAGEGGGGGGDG